MIFLDTETTSLNADTGIINTIGITLPNGETKLLFADDIEKEKELIQEALNLLKKFPNEQIIMWYSDFDIPFMVTRAIKNGLNISEIYNFQIIDLCKLVQEKLKFSSNKLDDVARFFGINKNLHSTGRDINNLYMLAVKGDKTAREQILLHCQDDLNALKKIFEKLEPYLKNWLKRSRI